MLKWVIQKQVACVFMNLSDSGQVPGNGRVRRLWYTSRFIKNLAYYENFKL